MHNTEISTLSCWMKLCIQINCTVDGYVVYSLDYFMFYSDITSPGGVLRYISDGKVRSPFLGLKLAILDFF